MDHESECVLESMVSEYIISCKVVIKVPEKLGKGREKLNWEKLCVLSFSIVAAWLVTS